jgi:hypothetical protein
MNKILTLFIQGKTSPSITQPGYGTDMRSIERWANTNNLFPALTAAAVADLPTPPIVPFWGFTDDGHIYIYPTGGPWTLVI